ncbi:MAG TPA: DegT/DnrJ/EryC1/StrS family aminotransferase, partial [Waddliaceae bacterium]
HITTGEGGMVLTDNAELAARARKLCNLAFKPEGPRFVHHELGWNYRMTNMQAALGVAQLEKIEKHLTKKREIGKAYQEGLKNLKSFQLPLHKTDYAKNIYWVFTLVADTEKLREDTVTKMTKAGIGTRPFFWPMHQQPVFRDMGLFIGEKYPVAEKLARQGFYIPSGLGLSKEEIQEVIKILT